MESRTIGSDNKLQDDKTQFFSLILSWLTLFTPKNYFDSGNLT